MAYKFKVGDKVRVIAGKKRLENISLDETDMNRTGKISFFDGASEPKELCYGVQYEEVDNFEWFAAKDLELVEKRPEDGSKIRTFDTGATRDTDVNKLDYEAFFSPLVLKRYAEYLNKHRVQSDGTLRDGDNWQKGLPKDVYMKSKIRHGMQTWLLFDGFPAIDEKGNNIDIEESLCAEIFNAMGYLFELLKEKK